MKFMGLSVMSSNYIVEANKKENNQCRILSSQLKLWYIYVNSQPHQVFLENSGHWEKVVA